MGTLHRESRARLEELRICDAIADDEWLCMARALQALDRDFTSRCRSGRVPYAEIADVQRARYRACAVAADRETIACTVLTTNPTCIASCCTPEAD